jgi:hypothetical protein
MKKGARCVKRLCQVYSQVHSPSLHEYGVFGKDRKKGSNSVKIPKLFPLLSTLSRAMYNLYTRDIKWKYNYNNFNTHVYPQQTAPFKIYTTIIMTCSNY